MIKTNKSQGEILRAIFKDFSAAHTITSLAKEISITRMGVWKALKNLESDKLVILTPVGKGKTSTYNIRLNWENPLVEKALSMLLLEEAMKNQRWINNFLELEDKVDFLVLYGSILHSPEGSGDIDILSVVSNNKQFVEINKAITKIQKTQIKKIHALGFTEEELKNELILQKNKAFIDAIKKGVVLFGQDEFVNFVKKLKGAYLG